MTDDIPHADDVNVYDSLDERCACEHFLGKSLEEAEALFHAGFEYYQEDLMWMGPRAFCYYVPAAISYIHSDASVADSDALNYLAGVLEWWLDRPTEIAAIASQLAAASEYVATNYAKFGVDESLYGNLRQRYESLQWAFEKIARTP